MKRRRFMKSAGLLPAAFFPVPGLKDEKLTVTGIAVHEVKVNARGNWHFIELKTNKGITGLGEASHGFSAAAKNGAAQLHAEARLWAYRFTTYLEENCVTS
ncbi:hypothetical protein [Dyadobacter bucti]|uniref:hypothetical protein n=1 Tax=Dyadobacter bucti TaxID=2572203 RepID=UPI003F71B87B